MRIPPESNPNMRGALYRLSLACAVAILLASGLLLVPALRTRCGSMLGQFLAYENPLQVSDAILIAVDGTAPELLEAAELVKEGWSKKVWVLAGPVDPIAAEFARRGIRFADKTEVSLLTLRALGVREVESVADRVDGSNNEAKIMAGWSQSQGYRRVIFVVASDHARRIHRMTSRELRDAGSALDLRVRFSRYTRFDATNWWRTRGGVRIVVVEYQKLLLDWIAHPLDF